MSEQSSEDRYVMESAGGVIHLVDTAGERPIVIESYADPLSASARLAVLNRRAAAGMDNPSADPLVPLLADEDVPSCIGAGMSPTPAGFLAMLPAYAERQRTGALLAEAGEVEAEAMRMIRTGAEVLARAISVRERLTARLDRLSAPQTAQNASGVGRDTLEPLGPDQGVFRNVERYAPGPY